MEKHVGASFSLRRRNDDETGDPPVRKLKKRAHAPVRWVIPCYGRVRTPPCVNNTCASRTTRGGDLHTWRPPTRPPVDSSYFFPLDVSCFRPQRRKRLFFNSNSRRTASVSYVLRLCRMHACVCEYEYKYHALFAPQTQRSTTVFFVVLNLREILYRCICMYNAAQRERI